MFSGIAQMCTYWHGKNSRRDSPGVDPGIIHLWIKLIAYCINHVHSGACFLYLCRQIQRSN